MRDLGLLAWLTQLGFSVAFPLAGFMLLAVWLRDSCGWGSWVIWVCLVFGVCSAVNGFRTSLKVMEQLGKKKKEKDPPPLSFNEHD